MFKRLNRLTSTREIWSIQRSRPFFSTHLVLKAAQGRGPTWRCAVVISTKISKRAIVRNRMKRAIREVVGSLLKDSTAKVDFIISAKRVVPKEFSPYREEITFLLNRARIL